MPYFGERLERAKSVLFIADNCGEVVFDRVFIETMLDACDIEVLPAVRGAPIINDVTELEAREVGMEGPCSIISSGMEMPGALLPRTTGRFRESLDGVDLIISKALALDMMRSTPSSDSRKRPVVRGRSAPGISIPLEMIEQGPSIPTSLASSSVTSFMIGARLTAGNTSMSQASSIVSIKTRSNTTSPQLSAMKSTLFARSNRSPKYGILCQIRLTFPGGLPA